MVLLLPLPASDRYLFLSVVTIDYCVFYRRRSKRPVTSIQPEVLAIGAHTAFLQRDSGYASVFRLCEQQPSGSSVFY